MVWPGVSDYQEAVQAPQLCFQDAELKAGSPVLTKLGLPRPISGGNASVYQVRSGKTEYAVRCFLRNIPDLRQRYAAIDQHLRASKFTAKVGFDYLQEGIRIRGHWYPILKMEWVRGVPLNEHVAGIRGDAAALRRLAADWCALQRDLEQAAIAHGDLQHGNVLVQKGQLVLIDYDGMFVPALRGQLGHELGHPSYQHPLREAADFGPDIDRFAALTIHVALLALSLRPALWDTYDNSDNLLFVRTDFADPDGSPLFAELQQLGDADFQAEVRALRAACGEPFARVPRLHEAVAAGRALANAPRPAAPATTQAGAVATPAPLPASVPAASGRAGTGKPQWLASLMSTPTAAGGGAATGTAGGAIGGAGAAAGAPAGQAAFSLAQAWQHCVPGQFTRSVQIATATTGARRRVFERRIVVGIAIALATVAAYAMSAGPLWIAAGSALAWAGAWWVRGRARGAAKVAPGAGAALPPAIAAMTFALDSRRIAVVGDIGCADVLEAATGKRLHRLGASGQAMVGAIALIGNRFAIAARAGEVHIHDTDGALVRSIRLGRLCCAAGAADGQTIAVGTANRQVKILDLEGRDRGTLRGHRDEVRCLAISRDNQQVVSGSADHTVRIWSIDNRSCLHVLRGHRAAITAIAASNNGRFVAAGASDGRLLIWDQKRAKLLHTLETGGQALAALAFAPDAAQLLVGVDRAIWCIDPIAGQVLGKVAGHAAPITALALSGDGSRVVTADSDGIALSWQRRVKAATAPRRGAQLQASRP